MNRHSLLAALCLCTSPAFAQTALVGSAGLEVSAAQQKKTDLRDALQASRRLENQKTMSGESVPAARHLSASELAEMREQLRRQKAVDRRSTP